MRKNPAQHQFQSDRGLRICERNNPADTKVSAGMGRRSSRQQSRLPCSPWYSCGEAASAAMRSMVEHRPTCSPWRTPPYTQYSTLSYTSPRKGFGGTETPPAPRAALQLPHTSPLPLEAPRLGAHAFGN